MRKGEITNRRNPGFKKLTLKIIKIFSNLNFQYFEDLNIKLFSISLKNKSKGSHDVRLAPM